MKISVTISDQAVLDLFTGHGGEYASAWLAFIEEIGEGRYRIEYDPEAENSFLSKMTFGPDDIAKGLGIMAQESPRQFGQFLAGDADDLTFDIALQCVIFGKVIYG
jgi:hypothetical protein